MQVGAVRVFNFKLESSKHSFSGQQAHQPQGQSASWTYTSSHSGDSLSPDDDSNCLVCDVG